MRRVALTAAVLAGLTVAGCDGQSTKTTEVGPPLDTGGGKGLPAMKPPGEGGGANGKVPKAPRR